MRTRMLAALVSVGCVLTALSGCVVVPGHEDHGRDYRDRAHHEHREGDRRDRRDDNENGAGMRSPNY